MKNDKKEKGKKASKQRGADKIGFDLNAGKGTHSSCCATNIVEEKDAQWYQKLSAPKDKK